MKKFITVSLLSLLSLFWGFILFRDILIVIPILLTLVVVPVWVGTKKGLWSGLLSLALMLATGTGIFLFLAYSILMMLSNAMSPYGH